MFMIHSQWATRHQHILAYLQGSRLHSCSQAPPVHRRPFLGSISSMTGAADHDLRMLVGQQDTRTLGNSFRGVALFSLL